MIRSIKTELLHDRTDKRVVHKDSVCLFLVLGLGSGLEEVWYCFFMLLRQLCLSELSVRFLRCVVA